MLNRYTAQKLYPGFESLPHRQPSLAGIGERATVGKPPNSFKTGGPRITFRRLRMTVRRLRTALLRPRLAVTAQRKSGSALRLPVISLRTTVIALRRSVSPSKDRNGSAETRRPVSESAARRAIDADALADGSHPAALKPRRGTNMLETASTIRRMLSHI